MKTLLTTLLILISINIYGQSEACEYDLIPPTFVFPDPCDTSLFDVNKHCLYANAAAVPTLDEIMDLVVVTIQDNCDEWGEPPYGMSFVCNYMNQYPNYHKIDCTVFYGSGNYAVDWDYFRWFLDIELKVYPNPSYGDFTVNKDYKVYDFRGELQKEPLKSGMYILKSGSEQIKLIIK